MPESDLTAPQRRELEKYISDLCDGLISDEDLERLEKTLQVSATARRLYLSQLELHGRLVWDCGYPNLEDDVPATDRSPDVACPQLQDTNTPMTSASLLATRGWISMARHSLMAAMLILGAILGALAVLFTSGGATTERVTMMAPDDHPLVPVHATLTRAIDVKWAAPLVIPELGDNTGTQLMRVLSGRLQISFATGVEVVVDGPAEFSHDGFGGVALSYGTLAASVPASAPGFSVFTSSAKILSEPAAEFGLVVNSAGQTELHGLSGSVFAGLLTDEIGENADHPLHEVCAGEAVRLERERKEIVAITPTRDRFTAISSQSLDVLDLLAGGNGLDDNLIYGIDASSGQRLIPRQLPTADEISDGTYHEVDWNRFVDGVFVPNPFAGSVRLDSAGHAYAGFPELSGQTWQGGITLHRSGYEQPISTRGEGVYNWLQSRDPEAFVGSRGAFLGMHANCGLTLDLDRIRALVPNGRLHHFEARLLHLRPNGPGARPPVLWVFLDGRLHASFRPNGRRKPVEIDVAFGPECRFLTLVTTDGDGNTAEDWMVLANPSLKWVTSVGDSMVAQQMYRPRIVKGCSMRTTSNSSRHLGGSLTCCS